MLDLIKEFLSSFFGNSTREISQHDLESMTKAEIDELAVQHGIKLDRRKTKDTMIKEFLGEL